MEKFTEIQDRFEPYVDFLDLRFFKGQHLSIVVENEEVACGARDILGVGVRCLVDGCWAFSSTSNVSLVEEAVEKAIKSARSLSPGDATVPELTFRRDYVKHSAKKDAKDVDLSEKIVDLHHLKEIMSLPHVKRTKILYNEAHWIKHVRNTMGCNIEETYSQIGIDFFSIASKQGKIEMASDRRYGVGGYELLENAGDIALNTSRRAERLLSAGRVTEGSYPVILDPELTGVFVHEALGHCAEADIVSERGSFLKDNLNKRIACEAVSICDDPQLPQGSVFFSYDDEGTPARRTLIVEKGRLMKFMHSLETAAIFETESTGNGRVDTYSSRPVIRMTNTYMLPGEESVEEMTEQVKEGVYLEKTFGAEVDITEGAFVFKTQEGHLIERGELTRELKNILVYGNIEEFLRNIAGVGRNFSMSSGTCAKANQVIIIGSGGPSILLSEMRVGVSL
ncbi:MAG: hypothetical protein AYK18_15080 [Theionarchaea archaeon DG-70]|nr:MAG: hypothetical protein AYK18_15080 [Theionarchaea archaeon DG-70]